MRSPRLRNVVTRASIWQASRGQMPGRSVSPQTPRPRPCRVCGSSIELNQPTADRATVRLRRHPVTPPDRPIPAPGWAVRFVVQAAAIRLWDSRGGTASGDGTPQFWGVQLRRRATADRRFRSRPGARVIARLWHSALRQQQCTDWSRSAPRRLADFDWLALRKGGPCWMSVGMVTFVRRQRSLSF